MKKIILTSFVLALGLASCKTENKQQVEEVAQEIAKIEMENFGEDFEALDVKSKEEMAKIFTEMKEGDTLQVQFQSEIGATCKKKGCWMSLDLGNEEKAIVKFKDYGFFVPKEGAEGKESIVNGMAYLSITSVNELKHDAKDAGKPQATIDSIVAPKIQKMIMATGVQIAK